MATGDYEIVIEGECSEGLRGAFEPYAVTVGAGRTTVHAGDVDQPTLHALLDRARSLGLTLIDVHREGQAR